MIIVKLSIFIQSIIKNKQVFYRQVVYGCPNCKFEGKLYSHGSYERNVITEEDSFRITIFRVKCPICGKTHALIPDFLIPYFQHSFDTIKKCLDLKFCESASYSKILDYFQCKNSNSYLSATAISGFIKRFINSVPAARVYFSTFTEIYSYDDTSEAALLKCIDVYNLSHRNGFNINYFQNMPGYFMSKA